MCTTKSKQMMYFTPKKKNQKKKKKKIVFSQSVRKSTLNFLFSLFQKNYLVKQQEFKLTFRTQKNSKFQNRQKKTWYFHFQKKNY